MADAARKKTGAPLQFGWDKMDVGDQFLVFDRTTSNFTGTLAHANKSRAPKRWTSRTVCKTPRLCIVIRRVK